jgi:hypothetical protein
MKYKSPIEVTSPKGKVKNLKILFDGGDKSYSLAKLKWNNKDCHAIRWNVSANEWSNSHKRKELKECIGMPSSRGYSTWFILPTDFETLIPLLTTDLNNKK